MNRQKSFFLSATLLVGFISFLMLAPYLNYLLMGLLLAFILYPAHRRFKDYLGDSGSALFMIILTLIAAILPFAIILGAVGNEASNLVNDLQRNNFDFLNQTEMYLSQFTGYEIDLRDYIEKGISKLGSLAAGSISGVVNLAASAAIGISLMLFLEFYALRDGKGFIEWTKEFDFVPDKIQNRLYSKTSSSIWAVIEGHVFIAISQGLLVGLGFFLLSLPNPFFWTFVMIIMGFIPMVGTAFIWIPAALYLVYQGNISSALILVIYAVLVSTIADNFLRPFLVDESADIHPFFIIIGLVGGIGIFGPTGIFLGPVIFGVLKSMLEVLKKDYDKLK